MFGLGQDYSRIEARGQGHSDPKIVQETSQHQVAATYKI